MTTIMFKVSHDEYISDVFETIKLIRLTEGVTENGNPLKGKWGLFKNGELVDYDRYINDIAEHHNLTLQCQ